MAEQRLWAPWRLDYIKGPKPDECIFCSKPSAGDDEAAHIVARGKRCYVMLNAFPYNNGHLMVVPNRHVATLGELTAAELQEIGVLTQRAEAALTEAYQPHGLNVGINLGKSAGAGILAHLHVHVVPRWSGDTNFMTVVSETRVLPESLDQTAARLRPIFDRLASS